MIDKINAVNTVTSSRLESAKSEDRDGTAFSKLFGAALDNINATSDTVKIADKMAVDFAIGKIDNPEQLMIAQEKASLAINYTTQLTNKVLEVYKEIMRMQI